MNRYSSCAGLCGLLALCASPSLFAACTTSSSRGDFGSLSSFTVASTPQAITSTSGFKCTGSLLSILSTNTIEATITSTTHAQGSSPRLYNARGNAYLPYVICSDSSCGKIYNVGSTARWSKTTFLGILGLFNGPDGSLPLYLRTATRMNLPAGTYSDTILLGWRWYLCAAGALGVCIYDEGSATSSINVTLTVLKDCFIDSAPDVSFGSAALVSAFTAVNQSIGVRCTLNASYSLGLDNGNHFSAGWRRMLSGANAIEYNLYKPGDSTVWTTLNTQRGVGSGVSQSVPYRAIGNPAQGNVPAGSYSDTVRVILTY
ncbi:spore coat U domain-containing protein [Pseudomonas sp. MSSRFD41]|uniref:Csu type fimbrial protein n=1 Tax=Pseudomonas sp. MSSRFD41 TaxID=1310370 RepID=UPI00163B1F59|nr:spore coat U domain-containing protein [Pseudomonas sp. MSSRFD41]MBC2656139.1 spore coat U domain-containing protein [Pseudomonas sp. MSSRFD41]